MTFLKMPLFDNGRQAFDPPHNRATINGLICAVFSVALAARIIPFLFTPSIYHPDEIFQVTEQAHRIVYGNGLIPWEFDYGTRSWLLPGIVIVIMEGARLFAEGPKLYLPTIWIFFAALSSLSVVCAFLWGQRFYGLAGGLLAAMMPAFAADAIYFSGHTLSEVVAAHVFIVGVYLAYPGYLVTSRGRFFSVGLLLGLTVILRLQLLPATATIMVWLLLARATRQLSALMFGFVIACILGGMLDTLTWGYPFLSMWRNFSFNLIYGVSSSFGVQPWYQYVGYVLAYWGGGVAILLALAFAGAYRLPLLLVVSVIIFLSHTVIPHKDYRFIYPALIILTVLAGVGLAQVSHWLVRLLEQHHYSRAYRICFSGAVAFCIIFVLGQSASRAIAPREDRRVPFWGRAVDMIRASAYVEQLPTVCGIGTLEISWWQTGGYTHFHLPVPYYWLDNTEELKGYLKNFNTLLYTGSLPPEFGFTTLKCAGSVCAAQRAGQCEPREMKRMPIPAPLAGVEALVQR